MHRYLRGVAALGVSGSMMLGVGAFGCTSRLGPVTATQAKGGVGHPNLQDIVLERGSECVALHGLQLEPGRHVFDTTVEVYEDGYNAGVTIDDIPNTAYDLGACMRDVLRYMPIAEEPLREGVAKLKAEREQAIAAQRSLVGSPVLVVAGVTIIVSEIVFEAGAVTILFAVTVKVVDAAKDDVIEAAKRWRRKPNKNRCLDAAAGGSYLWRAFCDSIPDPVDREACWSRDMESEQNKRGWCNQKYGN